MKQLSEINYKFNIIIESMRDIQKELLEQQTKACVNVDKNLIQKNNELQEENKKLKEVIADYEKKMKYLSIRLDRAKDFIKDKQSYIDYLTSDSYKSILRIRRLTADLNKRKELIKKISHGCPYRFQKGNFCEMICDEDEA